MAPPPTITLERRATSTSSLSSSSTSLDCDGKDKNSDACEKPATENGLEIGLGVGIPVFLIACVLGFFVWKNYRKNKLESMEHDPDFDENGEATALPDFPAFTKEDPFANRHLSNQFGRYSNYPMMGQNRSANDLRSTLTRGGDDGYVDGFMLPYHHQIGSKASLDEYAKQIIKESHTQNRVNSVYSRQLSQLSHAPGSTRVSPLKKLVNGSQQQLRAPVGKLHANDYAKLQSQSTNSLATEFYNTKENFESDDTSGETLKGSGNQFDVEYENELLPAINTLHAVRAKLGLSREESDDVVSVPDSDVESVPDDDDSDDDDAGFQPVSAKKVDQSSGTTPPKQIPVITLKLPSFEVQSPFEDVHQLQPEETEESEEKLQLPVHVRPGERSDGDFDFSNDHVDETNSISDESTHDPDQTMESKDSNRDTSSKDSKLARSPRMSAFNMLKNVSDDEDEEVPVEPEVMSPDQEEELARMKSVYKVYFDRANSMKSVQTVQTEDGARQFQADPSQPLPAIDVDNLKINDELRGDTNYDKRKTTTSSIYEENPLFQDQRDRIVIHPHQQFNAPPNNQFAQNEYYAQQQYMQSQNAQNLQIGQLEQDEAPQELRPLKSLPHASDIRNSTIETFTDYQPRAKMTLPSLRLNTQFENGEQTTSPYMSSQASFASPTSANTGDLPPMIRNNSGQSAKPSASQLSRTSVVMLDPVSEITTLRKFKPAGSLSGVAPVYHQNDELAHSNDDLIPGNRKSQVRRMMNTNF